LVDQTIGALPKDMLRELIQRHLGAAIPPVRAD
jgi:hypothetical protein